MDRLIESIFFLKMTFLIINVQTSFASVKNMYLKLFQSYGEFQIETSLLNKDDRLYFINNNNLIPTKIVTKNSYSLPFGVWEIKLNSNKKQKLLRLIKEAEQSSDEQKNIFHFHQFLKIKTKKGFVNQKYYQRIKNIFNDIILNSKLIKKDGEILSIKNNNPPLLNFSETENKCSKIKKKCFLHKYGLIIY